jgi:hypothetical protein
MAACYAQSGERAKARAGLEWSVEAAEAGVARAAATQNETSTSTTTPTPATPSPSPLAVSKVEAKDEALALLGMALDALATFYSEGANHAEAAAMYTRTVAVCEAMSRSKESFARFSLCFVFSACNHSLDRSSLVHSL